MASRPRFARLLTLAVALGLCVFVVAACGGDDNGGSGATLDNPDPVANYCPANEDGSVPADALDANELIGLELEDAEPVAAEAGCEIRITWQDGEGLPVTMDLRPNRINVFAEGTTITEIDSIG